MTGLDIALAFWPLYLIVGACVAAIWFGRRSDPFAWRWLRPGGVDRDRAAAEWHEARQVRGADRSMPDADLDR
ncbi:hypothetical protein DXV76_20005 [Rhodobacteraceae bacterium CCMM004]|nr:hypothetical protein DXV76_20005 [Rhodobacteraceae bacterium CCMM004]